MAVVKMKPTSPGRRSMVRVVTPDLYKGRPFDALTTSQKQNAGRNNHGRITVRHRGGGHKAHYRVIDFRRDKDGIPATVERIEYDPNRSAHIALLCYDDGERRYILAPRGVVPGDRLQSGSDAPIRPGHALPIRNIQVASTMHPIVRAPRRGARVARSSGTSARLTARGGIYAQVRMRSGQVRRFHIDCGSSIGEVGNQEHVLREIGKAGAKRWRG